MKQVWETTQEERIQIARDCIACGRNYGEMALKYQVSYQQVRTWTQRFEALGEEGLKDRRDKRKKDQQPRTELGQVHQLPKNSRDPHQRKAHRVAEHQAGKAHKQKPWLFCALLGQIPQPPNRFIISQKGRLNRALGPGGAPPAPAPRQPPAA